MKLPSVILAASMLVLSGCAMMRSQGAADSEKLLGEAGFQQAAIEAGELNGIQPLQLTKHGDHYDFADPEFCKCRYTGGEKELKVLNDLRAARVRAHEYSVRAIGLTSAGADENGWGPWKPEGLDLRYGNSNETAGSPAENRAAAR